MRNLFLENSQIKNLLERNIDVYMENRKIIQQGFYEMDGKTVHLNFAPEKYQSVEVLTPERIRGITEDSEKLEQASFGRLKDCDIQVVNADSYQHKTELVMNFANALCPGGGYLVGAMAQEECLCRESTLYASLSSDAASEMYAANRNNENVFDTDYMLLSPCVDVFRNASLELLETPYTVAVMTVAAPNLNDRKVGAVSRDDIAEYMKRRIRQYLKCSAYYGYRTITLGAWGCGAFGHDARNVAGYFREVVVDEGFCRYFDRILFAVYDATARQYNYNSFKEAF